MPINVSVLLVSPGGLILAIAAAAVACNVLLGYLREGVRKFSPAWFLYVHLSVPLIIYLRVHNELSYMLIPLFITCAVGGQLIGGRIRRKRESNG